MVEAQEVQQRGVEVAHVDRIGDRLKSDRIGLAVAETWLDAAASEPDRERVRVMVAADECHLATAAVFAHGRAAELAAPNHERLV